MDNNIIISFVNKNFKSGNVDVQVDNYNKLLSFLCKNNVDSFNKDDSLYLINNSPKIKQMIIKLFKSKEYDKFDDNNTTIFNDLLLSYLDTVENNMELENDFNNEELSAISLLFRDIKEYGVLSKEEELDLFEEYDNALDNEEKIRIRNQIINHNIRLVIKIANMFTNYGVPVEELTQEGVFGLIRAIDKFDYTKGYKFSTYAFHWIKNSVLRGIGRMYGDIRLSYNGFELFVGITGFQSDFLKDNGRMPTLTEIAKEFHISEARVKEIMISQDMVFLNTNINYGDDSSDNEVGYFIIDPKDSFMNSNNKMTRTSLRKFIQSTKILSDREKEILLDRFGFNNYDKPLVLTEIAQKYGVTAEAIRMTCIKAINKLKRNAVIKEFKYEDFITDEDDRYILNLTKYKS